MKTTHKQTLPQKLLFITDVEQMVGRSRVTLRRWWSINQFPKPIKLNDTSLVWHIETIERWINQSTNQNNTLSAY